jgi:hypothetical protein
LIHNICLVCMKPYLRVHLTSSPPILSLSYWTFVELTLVMQLEVLHHSQGYLRPLLLPLRAWEDIWADLCTHAHQGMPHEIYGYCDLVKGWVTSSWSSSKTIVQGWFSSSLPPLEFDTQEEIGSTWMTDEARRHSTFTRFGKLLGYTFDGMHSPRGHRIHLDTSEYNKKKIQCLYYPGAKREKPPTFSHYMISYSECSMPSHLHELHLDLVGPQDFISFAWLCPICWSCTLVGFVVWNSVFIVYVVVKLCTILLLLWYAMRVVDLLMILLLCYY